MAAGCASIGAVDSREATVSRATTLGFARQDIAAGPFRLAAFVRRTAAGSETLSIYIEGDGAPWDTPWHPPRDPTPVKPVALAMALADTAPAVSYLSRPCQYLDEAALRQCDSAWWMGRRFAPEVVAAYDEAIARLKSDFGARRIRLVGHSGGGVIAALLAFRRTDVEQLVTVAAPLALTEWVAWHDITPLTG
ncbi:MAG: alpha/beta hydrolase, partial [Rhodocyclaceae bacterium]|nr:alpha/beta hydrolase [Rhodocyclaceae bacterium]